MLYEMIAGRQPFPGPTTIDVMSGILNREPESLLPHMPEGPRELDRIISRTMRKDREERYQTVKDLLIDLKDLKRELETQSQRAFVSRTSVDDVGGVCAGEVDRRSLLRKHELGKGQRLLLRGHD